MKQKRKFVAHVRRGTRMQGDQTYKEKMFFDPFDLFRFTRKARHYGYNISYSEYKKKGSKWFRQL